MSRVLSTLAGIPFFHSGVGHGDDLLVRVREDPSGGWLPLVHTGHYYIGTEQGYLFSSKGSTTFSPGLTGSIHTAQVTGLTDDPTRLGPILLWSSNSVRPLQRVTSPLRAYRDITLSGSDPKTTTIPGLLVSLVSQPVTGILLSVPATGDIIDNTEYVYDPRTGAVYLRDSNPPHLYATYLVDETDPNLLRQEEILRVSTDGQVRTMRRNVFFASGSILSPTVKKPGPLGSISTTGILVTQNAITLPSCDIVSGDIVRCQYYVGDSFTAVPSGTLLLVQVLPTMSGTYTLEYETGVTGWYDTSQLASGAANYIQLNPILVPRESGFLYMVDASEAWPTAGKVRLAVSNANPIYSASGCAAVVLSVKVLDQEGESLPQTSVTVTATGASGVLALTYPATAVTDGIGQVLYSWTPQGTGIVTVTATCSGTSVSGTLQFTVRPISAYTSQTERQLGKLLLHMEETPFLGELRRLNAYYCYADGAPFQPNDQTTTWIGAVTFTADHSQFFTLDGLPLAKPVTISTDGDSVASVLVDPAPGDMIRATIVTPTAGRIRTAAPLRIPEAVSRS
jgi:hypothetical protein